MLTEHKMDCYTKYHVFLHSSSKALLETTKWTESAGIHVYFALSIKQTLHLLKHVQKASTYIEN